MVEEERVTLAVISNELKNLTEKVDSLTSAFNSTVVTRNEWGLRNQYVDSQLKSAFTDIDELKKGRGPWWVWVMAAVALISLAWNFLQPIIQTVVER